MLWLLFNVALDGPVPAARAVAPAPAGATAPPSPAAGPSSRTSQPPRVPQPPAVPKRAPRRPRTIRVEAPPTVSF
jgi:hypothetical protein